MSMPQGCVELPKTRKKDTARGLSKPITQLPSIHGTSGESMETVHSCKKVVSEMSAKDWLRSTGVIS